MKTSSFRGVHALWLLIVLLVLAPPAPGQDATLLLTVASDALTAGDSLSVWMTALNPTGNDLVWTFPAAVKSKFISPQGTVDGSLVLQTAETNLVTITPGTFARREYVAAVPDSVAGQVVLEFPGLDVNRVVLDVEARPADATHPAPAATSSSSNRVIPGLNLELIWVQPGSFTNGSPEDEPFRNQAEDPRTG